MERMEEEAVSSTVSNGAGAGGEDGQRAGPCRGLHRALGETHTGAPWLSTFPSPSPCRSLQVPGAPGQVCARGREEGTNWNVELKFSAANNQRAVGSTCSSMRGRR